MLRRIFPHRWKVPLEYVSEHQVGVGYIGVKRDQVSAHRSLGLSKPYLFNRKPTSPSCELLVGYPEVSVTSDRLTHWSQAPFSEVKQNFAVYHSVLVAVDLAAAEDRNKLAGIPYLALKCLPELVASKNR